MSFTVVRRPFTTGRRTAIVIAAPAMRIRTSTPHRMNRGRRRGRLSSRWDERTNSKLDLSAEIGESGARSQESAASAGPDGTGCDYERSRDREGPLRAGSKQQESQVSETSGGAGWNGV